MTHSELEPKIWSGELIIQHSINEDESLPQNSFQLEIEFDNPQRNKMTLTNLASTDKKILAYNSYEEYISFSEADGTTFGIFLGKLEDEKIKMEYILRDYVDNFVLIGNVTFIKNTI